MKSVYLFIIGLVLTVGCQSNFAVSTSDFSDTIPKFVNPTLLTFQFLTVELRNDKGKWPANESDYTTAFGDSAKFVLADFTRLEFQNRNDSLIINYSLRELDKELESNDIIEFVEPQHAQTSKYKLEGKIQETKNNKRFKSNEGEIVFFAENNSAISIVHKSAEGVTTNKITPLQ